jgi:hypothetical protein
VAYRHEALASCSRKKNWVDLLFAPFGRRPGLVGGSAQCSADQAGQRQRRDTRLSGTGGWRARGFYSRLLHGLEIP